MHAINSAQDFSLWYSDAVIGAFTLTSNEHKEGNLEKGRDCFPMK